MTPAEALNQALAEAAPVAASALSDMGRRIWFPRGVPAQSVEAKDCAVNATIGQITDGHGGAIALPAIAGGLHGLTLEDAVLYPATGGVPALRQAWRRRLAATAGEGISLPVVAGGLTHALSTAADLFVDAETDVIIPDPCWGNYRLILEVRRAGHVLPWPILDGDHLDLAGLRTLLATRDRKTVLVLNFPSNPGGYTPTPDEARALVETLAACQHPLVVICDDAYLGMVWEPDRLAASLFDAVVAAGHPHVVPVKVDGATKELFFFGGRVGFLTFGLCGPAAAVLEEKAVGLLRSSTSTSAAPSQAVVLAALGDPDLAVQREAILAGIRDRYRRLKAGLQAAGIRTLPFQGAFFVLIPTPGDPEPVRQALLAEGVGVVAFGPAQALRVSYASVALEDIDTLVQALRVHLAP